MNNNKERKANVGITIFLLIIAFVLLLFSVKQQMNTEKEKEELSQEISKRVINEVSEIIEQEATRPSEFPDYDSLERLKSLVVVNNFESWTPDAKVDIGKTKKVIVVEKGKLAKGNLYVRASINSKALSKWESIYVKMNNEGGHLFRIQSLSIPKSEKTELLYSLDDIPYLFSVPYSEQKIPARADWFKFFRDKRRIELITFISSLKPVLIESMVLYYECIDDTECLLSIE